MFPYYFCLTHFLSFLSFSINPVCTGADTNIAYNRFMWGMLSSFAPFQNPTEYLFVSKGSHRAQCSSSWSFQSGTNIFNQFLWGMLQASHLHACFYPSLFCDYLVFPEYNMGGILFPEFRGFLLCLGAALHASDSWKLQITERGIRVFQSNHLDSGGSRRTMERVYICMRIAILFIPQGRAGVFL